jgi:hypothetical protein
VKQKRRKEKGRYRKIKKGEMKNKGKIKAKWAGEK